MCTAAYICKRLTTSAFATSDYMALQTILCPVIKEDALSEAAVRPYVCLYHAPSSKWCDLELRLL